MTPLVRIRDLCLHLNGRAILHHVDLELPRHGISVLLGRSGSGKTSFLRCLNRLHDCTRDSRMQGKIELLLDGTMQDISRLQGEEALSRLRRQVGMVFQTPNVLPASIGQNLLLPLQLAAGLDMDEARSRARRSLEDVGLWPEVHDRLGEPAASLSGGQQQRLCLARTLALEPQILLLDEPTASLDPASTRRIEDLLRHLSKRYAIILVSHGISQARRLAARLLLFEGGHARGPFPPEELARIFPPHGGTAAQA